ncbi:VWA domain-containing protein [Oceanobacter kriegii]|uniref:VWA domain-containing protein n=1 Tax=Oceanobacter kriegii TaxID=64972 RepID=UPI000407F04B|nr:VWA domain-containing protein [Oceanobacter kriegii]
MTNSGFQSSQPDADKVRIAGHSIKQQLSQQHDHWLRSNPQAEDLIKRKLQRWDEDTRVIMMREFPFKPQLQRLRRWESRVVAMAAELGASQAQTDDQNNYQATDDTSAKTAIRKLFEQIFKEFRQFCQVLSRPLDEDYWLHLDEDIVVDSGEVVEVDENPIFHLEMLLAEWQKTLDHARSEWELQRISECRQQFLADIDELLLLLGQLHHQLEPLGMSSGLLFDLSATDIKADDLRELQRWSNYLNNDDGVKAISELLGKLRQLELSQQLEQVNARDLNTGNWHDNHARDELVGLRLGRDLEHVLPSELALLSDPDTELLFDLKFIESRLMCFDVQSLDHQPEEDEDGDPTDISRAVRGPMIICVDTSGSMSGPPMTVAKAVTLFLASQAREENRPCLLISYSTSVEELSLSDEQDPEQNRNNLMAFLTRSFEGGTDITPALERSLELMQTDQYRRADLLVISDFLMAELPEPLPEKIETTKQRGNHFHSLVIGETYMLDRMKHLFDQEWVYDPHRSEIKELVTFKKRVVEER